MFIKSLLYEDLTPYLYFMKEEQVKSYQKKKILFALIPLLVIFISPSNWFYLVLASFVLYKVPYLLLKLQHNANCNKVVDAVPLWINTIYALVEKNTIHNSIVNSLDVTTPPVMRKELTEFIEKIEKNPDDKSAYVGFLAKYDIDGFFDIMLKFYEFRELSKEKLKYELKLLNEDLSKLESIKRQRRFKGELTTVDILACILLFASSIFLMFLFMSPSLMRM